MTIPLIGIGHGLTLAQLVEFVVEPQTGNGVQYAQRDRASDGTIHEQGAFCPLLWPLVEDEDQLEELLAQMGLEGENDQRTAVTVYLHTRRPYIWHVYNAYANFPPNLTVSFWPQDLRIMLNGLTVTDLGL